MISCSGQTNNNSFESYETFESFLGQEKASTLNKKVKHFESFLDHTFSNESIEESYIDFLILISRGEYDRIKWENADTTYEDLYKLFESSGLREEIFLVPDSVWVVDEALKAKYSSVQEGFLNEFTEESFLIGFDINQNPDSVIKAKYEERKFNPYGKYLIGLKMIENPNAFLTKYIQMKEAVGDISKNILADELLKSKADFSDYFIKRIVIVEFY